MKELKPSGLFYVPVPMDAFNFGIPKQETENLFYELKGYLGCELIKLPKGKWEFIGSVTAEHIDFDCNKIVESEYVAGGIMAYKNYTTNDFDFVFATDSLRSLLTANDVHFVNPHLNPNELYADGYYDEPIDIEVESGDGWDKDQYKSDLIEWQQAESKLVEKILILKPL